MCQHASDIISQLSAALVNGLTVGQLLAVMRPHPSFEEAIATEAGASGRKAVTSL